MAPAVAVQPTSKMSLSTTTFTSPTWHQLWLSSLPVRCPSVPLPSRLQHGTSCGCPAYQRRRSFEDFHDAPRFKRGRMDYPQDRDAYYRDKNRDRAHRYGIVRTETFLNGTYSDYMREFTRAGPPVIPPAYGPPPASLYTHMSAPPSYMYGSRSRHYPMSLDYPPPQPLPPHSRSSRAAVDKRSVYERDVEDFLRRTSGQDRRDRDRSHRREHHDRR
ncbi:hypothetical protein NP493_377g02046 [Ridgeia piscesae]|uniref:Uncharacterized protein n=1 Tax=Ridgeia piscesae TaxID=27915 RepID=A0AAD9NVV7_RIDPI|nr:hypothetical protein NP493_377g02046 [Ridgeia piscesae]